MAFELRYEGESHHLIPLLGVLLVEDPLANEWHVEVTTKGGDRMVEGVIVAAEPYGHGTGGTITVEPWDYEKHEPTGEPAVTIDCDDVEELVIP